MCGGHGKLGCKTPNPLAAAAGAGAEEPVAEALEAEDIVYICPSCDAITKGLEAAVACPSCKEDRRYSGLLKSMGNDYGFIACEEVKGLFKRDVYVSKQVLKSAFSKTVATSGMTVDFYLSLNHDGQPNARAIKPPRGSGEVEVFHGTVKYVSEEKGYGFIECAETFESYQSDVYVDLEQLQGCSLGQRVSFSLRLGQVGGRPQAQRLSAAGPTPTDLPTMCEGSATELLRSRWAERVLLLGEGDLSFASAAATVHRECRLDPTVFVTEGQWAERFPNDLDRLADLREKGHEVRFEVDAVSESCAGYAVVCFNFPHLSVTEEAHDSSDGLLPSGRLGVAFLENAQRTADRGTLVILGLWGRRDGRPDPALYGRDAHALVAEFLRTCREQASDGSNILEDALEDGYKRDGVRADYGFYTPYVEAGYHFRTNCSAAFESSHREWHLQACFVLRVVSGPTAASWLDFGPD